MQQKLNIGKLQYNRDSSLFSGQAISKADYEKSQSTLLESKYSCVSSGTTADNALIQISQLEQNIIEQEEDYAEKKKQYELLLKESYDNLQAQIRLWEQTYVLKSPVNGVITFTKFWSVNQNVIAGDKVITVIPKEKSSIVGKVDLPMSGSGKVKVGQMVNIKLANYPYMEFGMLRGKVKTISLVPSDNNYSVEVEFPDGLKTNYGKQLEFSQEMQGTAEIITEDVRLLERFFNPIKSLLKKQ
jgi:HlyD family secretion protein